MQNLGVEIAPFIHFTFGNVISEMIDHRKTGSYWSFVFDSDIKYFAIKLILIFLIHEIDQRIPNAINSWEGSCSLLMFISIISFCPASYCRLKGVISIFNSKTCSADTRSMLFCKFSGKSLRLAIDDVVDITLAIKFDVFAMNGAHFFESVALK
ncbi:hypothetical protein D3C72_982020 [compost metagenome]